MITPAQGRPGPYSVARGRKVKVNKASVNICLRVKDVIPSDRFVEIMSMLYYLSHTTNLCFLVSHR